jgi:hypothetical protein
VQNRYINPTRCLNKALKTILIDAYLVYDFLQRVGSGETRNAYRILMGKLEEKRLLGRSRRTWMDNIEIDLREIEWDGVDWIDLAQDRDQWRAFVDTVMNLRVP